MLINRCLKTAAYGQPNMCGETLCQDLDAGAKPRPSGGLTNCIEGPLFSPWTWRCTFPAHEVDHCLTFPCWTRN
jgi:hypothetical protein